MEQFSGFGDVCLGHQVEVDWPRIAFLDPMGVPGMRVPSWGPNSFISMQFSAKKKRKIIAFLGVGAPLGKILDPP